MKNMTESELKNLLTYLKAKAQKGIEVNTSIVRAIDDALESEDPVEEEEPIEDEVPDEPDTPISDLKARIINVHSIHVTWKAHKEGYMDILYDTPKDKPWKHSVKRYTKPIPITDQAIIIWYGDSLQTARLKAVIGDWESEILEVDKSKPQPEPDPDPVVPTPDPDPIDEPDPVDEPIEEETPDLPEEPVAVDPTEPKPGQTQIALNFLDGVNFDVTVNGTLYPKELDFDYRWDNNGVLAGTKVVIVDGNFTTMELNPDQIRFEGLNNDGWGAFGYKVVNKDADANLYGTNSRHDRANQEFWGTAASVNAQGVIVSRMGSTVGWKDEQGNPITYPDPLFYKGFQDDPKNNPDNRIFDPIWSATGKMAISFLGYNRNADNPVV